jgi:hypothetical protein
MNDETKPRGQTHNFFSNKIGIDITKRAQHRNVQEKINSADKIYQWLGHPANLLGGRLRKSVLLSRFLVASFDYLNIAPFFC